MHRQKQIKSFFLKQSINTDTPSSSWICLFIIVSIALYVYVHMQTSLCCILLLTTSSWESLHSHGWCKYHAAPLDHTACIKGRTHVYTWVQSRRGGDDADMRMGDLPLPNDLQGIYAYSCHTTFDPPLCLDGTGGTETDMTSVNLIAKRASLSPPVSFLFQVRLLTSSFSIRLSLIKRTSSCTSK